MGKQLISYVQTHAEIFFPGVGNFAATLPPSNKSFTSFTMYRTDAGSVVVDVTTLQGVHAVLEIPAGNIKHMVYGNFIEENKVPVAQAQAAKKSEVKIAPNSAITPIKG